MVVDGSRDVLGPAADALRVVRYSSIDEVPLGVWSGLAPTAAVGLEAGHLRAVEESRINDLHPYYLVGFRGGQGVGIASCFVIDVDLSKLASADPPEVLAAVKCWRPDFLRLRVLEVGQLASLGSTIEALPATRVEFLRALAGEFAEIARVEGADLGVIRDVPVARYADFRVLEQYGYHPALGFPMARLALEWSSLDGYLTALKHRKRKNLRPLQDALRAPEMSVEVIDDYAPHAERLAELWRQVASRHDEYEHEHLSPAYFAAMARNLRGRSHVVALKRHDTIVAFGLGLIGDEEYLGVAEGLDHATSTRCIRICSCRSSELPANWGRRR